MSLGDAIKSQAAAIGFSACGIADAAQAWPAAARLAQWLEAGRHGSMDWMQTHAERRSHPLNLWPEAKTAIMLGASYSPVLAPLALLEQTQNGAISAYAARRDYHDWVKTRLKALAAWLQTQTGADVKVFVDTAPLMEKPLAQAAGLGWQGKHTNLVSRQHGSWLLLGAILTSHAIPPDAPETDHCGSCRACLDICPTDAFPAPYQLDARRCLAYLSIEHKGPIPRAFRKPMGNRILGCDDCLAVCPWNKFAAHSAIPERSDLQAQPLADLAALDDAAFRAKFAGTPIKRTGRDRFVRNVMIAIGNSGDPGLAPAAIARLGDASALVRGAAVWACAQLLDALAFDALKQAHSGAETDSVVLEEWACRIGETSCA